VKLIIEPADGVAPLLAAIKSAKTSIEIAIFRFDRKDVETALKAAAARGVRVTALIVHANRGGAQSLRRLELRFLDAGIIVARTANDLVRYHGKYILIDRRILYVLSFNFTHLDIDHSRGFGIVTTHATWVGEAVRLFRADCTRTKYAPKTDTFVVSPANSRNVIGTFLKRAKKELLIYDPKISDKEMLRILQERAKAGVNVRVVGKVAGIVPFESHVLGGTRLHTRTIVRDRRQAFVGSQSLRAAEMDSRRELGLIIQDAKAVKKLVDTFETDWTASCKKNASAPPQHPEEPEVPTDAPPAVSEKQAQKAVEVLTKELDPLAVTVKKAVRKAVAQAGDDVLHDPGVKDTMKKVVKKAVKEAVKEAVQEAQDAQNVNPG
jgi:phosphatidylserine/phosphatidylglycerophosphate/cardiolipin synthase-like enzyme